MSLTPNFSPLAPATPAGPSPLRSARSIRRTSTIDTTWPEGLGKPMRMLGDVRDIYTPADDPTPQVIAHDWTSALVSFRREILAIEASRSNDIAQALIGARAGGHMRAAVEHTLPVEFETATGLHLLLDDHAGASLVATWAWSRHGNDWLQRVAEHGPTTAGRNGQFIGICSGFRPGSSALNPDGSPVGSQSSAIVPPLPHPGDLDGWHAIRAQTGVGARRARRTDVWLDGDVQIDIHFQDTATSPSGGDRIAVHEYRVRATASRGDMTLIAIEATPHVLPFSECPGAAPNVANLIGAPLARFRTEALERLPGVVGCTHLNDVMRSMADIPALTQTLIAKIKENN